MDTSQEVSIKNRHLLYCNLIGQTDTTMVQYTLYCDQLKDQRHRLQYILSKPLSALCYTTTLWSWYMAVLLQGTTAVYHGHCCIHGYKLLDVIVQATQTIALSWFELYAQGGHLNHSASPCGLNAHLLHTTQTTLGYSVTITYNTSVSFRGGALGIPPPPKV